MHRLIIAIALAACTTQAGPTAAAATTIDARAAYYRDQAALLGVAGWHLIATTTGQLNVTVPCGRHWLATNYLQIDVNMPIVDSSDLDTPGDRRHLANRRLDVRDAVTFPSGTNIRNNTGQNVAYIWYLDPDEAADRDPRLGDPESLYFERMIRLDTLELHEAEIERGGGGSINDDLRIALPGTAPIVVIAGDVFEAAWATVGWTDAQGTPLNLFDEGSSNAASVRIGGRLLQPLPRGAGLELACKRASWSGDPSPGTAYPNAGSCTLLWAELPEGW